MSDPLLLGKAPETASLLPLARGAGWPDTPRATPHAVAEGELSVQLQQLLAPKTGGRRKIWEFDVTLHCSIIGTCLTTSELRQVMLKLAHTEAAGASDHDLHASGVRVAGRPHNGARLLHKALDRRHRLAIHQFERAKTAGEVRALWQEAMQRGDIPGAYWAALTHPATGEALLREIFADVHMLSHLMGAANRADIRRLRQLESENAALQDKVERQQRQLRDAIVARDATIRDLTRTLETRIDAGQDRFAAPEAASDNVAWTALAADLKLRLERFQGRSERLARQLEDKNAALRAAQDARAAAKQQESVLRHELETIETSLAALASDAPEPERCLDLVLLYVGGRPAQIGHLRAVAERHGAVFLHHDGGIEERGGLLPGLVSRADAVLFPVNCVSHAAMLAVKRLCQQAEKPLLPLRSSGLAPFFAALQDLAANGGKA
jgi:hypothetical protein